MTKSQRFIDDRISIETARLAKEKGFDVPVFGSYTEYLVDKIDPEYPEGGGPFSMTKGEVQRDTSYFKNNNRENGDYSCKNYTMYARPTHEELQRWLRKTHGIEVFVKPFYIPQLNREGCFKYHGLVMLKECLGDCNVGTECKDEYEDAFEAALVLGLNMIKK